MLCYLRAQDVDMDAGRALNRLVNTAAWRLKLELDESVNALGVEQRLESHEVTPKTAWPGVLLLGWRTLSPIAALWPPCCLHRVLCVAWGGGLSCPRPQTTDSHPSCWWFASQCEI
jgi:hypothetical protein